MNVEDILRKYKSGEVELGFDDIHIEEFNDGSKEIFIERTIEGLETGETISLLFPEKEHVKELKLAIEKVETTLKVEAAELESLLNKINRFYENDEQGLAALDFAKAFDNLVTALEINHEEIKSDQTEQELQETLEDFMYTSDEESRELMNVYSAVDSDTIKLLKEEQEILRERWAYTISDEGGGQFDYDNPAGISIDGGEIEWIETNNEVTKTRKVDWEP